MKSVCTFLMWQNSYTVDYFFMRLCAKKNEADLKRNFFFLILLNIIYYNV